MLGKFIAYLVYIHSLTMKSCTYADSIQICFM